MSYIRPSLEVAAGVVFAYLMYVVATKAVDDDVVLYLFSGTLVVFGLYVTAHGIFTGIETAVNEQLPDN